MKKLLFIMAATIFVATSWAQDFSRLQKSEKTNLVTFQKIIELPNQNKSQIFSNCMAWIATNYVSGKYVTQLSDAEGGKIIIKPIAYFTFNQSVSAECNYTLTISVKDGKARAVIDQLYSEHTPNTTYPGWGYAEEWLEGKANGYKQPTGSLKRLSAMANALADHIDGIFASLEQYLSSQTEEDW
jgi:hypothetical protein